MGLLKQVTREQIPGMKRASEVGRRAVDDDLRGLAEALSELLWPVDIYFEDRNGDGIRELHVEHAPEPNPGYGKMYVDGRVFSLPGGVFFGED